MFTCPVCTWPKLESDPAPRNTYEICPRCGTEFGYDDDDLFTYAQLRARWEATGCRWWSASRPAPADDA